MYYRRLDQPAFFLSRLPRRTIRAAYAPGVRRWHRLLHDSGVLPAQAMKCGVVIRVFAMSLLAVVVTVKYAGSEDSREALQSKDEQSLDLDMRQPSQDPAEKPTPIGQQRIYVVEIKHRSAADMQRLLERLR